MSDIAKELFKSIVTDTASQEDFGSAIKQKMDQALDVRKAGITAGIYNQQVQTPETVVEESTDLEEAKIPSSNISKFSDPKLAKSAASKQKYKTQVFMGDDGKFWVPSTNKEAGQLKKDGYEVYESVDLEEASSGDIAKILKFAAKNGAKVKGNVADFGGSKIEFSLDKGKIKFDGGKDSGIEHFDNVRDAISTLSIGMED